MSKLCPITILACGKDSEKRVGFRFKNDGDLELTWSHHRHISGPVEIVVCQNDTDVFVKNLRKAFSKRSVNENCSADTEVLYQFYDPRHEAPTMLLCYKIGTDAVSFLEMSLLVQWHPGQRKPEKRFFSRIQCERLLRGMGSPAKKQTPVTPVFGLDWFEPGLAFA